MENNKFYHEVREKIAIAFETQVCQFLNDAELHDITLQIYPQLYAFKISNPDMDYEINVTELEDHSFFTHIVSKFPEVNSTAKNFISDLKLHLDILLDQFLEEHENIQIEDCIFKIEQKDKSISISVESKL